MNKRVTDNFKFKLNCVSLQEYTGLNSKIGLGSCAGWCEYYVLCKKESRVVTLWIGL